MLLPQTALLVDSGATNKCLHPRWSLCEPWRVDALAFGMQSAKKNSQTAHRPPVTPRIRAAKDAPLHLGRDESVPHDADSKENLLLANQKDYFIIPHMNGSEGDRSPLSLSRLNVTSRCLPRSVSLPPSVTLAEKCSTALYCANAELQLFLTAGL